MIPRGAADAGVLAPVPGSPLGVALAVAGNPRFGHIDARLAAQHAVYEAVRSVVAVGAQPIALTDCLNFGNPRKVGHYTQLVDAIDGLATAANAFETPFVSGNVSLYNEGANGKAIPASAIVSCVGALQDVSHVVTMPFKAAGSVLYFVGRPQEALGGSVVLDVLGRHEARLPLIDYTAIKPQHALIQAAARAGLLRSAHDIGSGGLIVAVCEMAFPTLTRGHKAIGAQIDDPWQWTHGRVGNIEALFGEAGGFVIEVSANDIEAFEGLADDVEGVYEIGVTIGDPILAVEDEAFDLRRLRELWEQPLREVYP